MAHTRDIDESYGIGEMLRKIEVDAKEIQTGKFRDSKWVKIAKIRIFMFLLDLRLELYLF